MRQEAASNLLKNLFKYKNQNSDKQYTRKCQSIILS